MAPFKVTAVIAHPAAPKRVRRLRLRVETASTLSWLSGSLLEALGVIPVSSACFERRDGSRISAKTGLVLVTLQGRTAAVPVAFGPPDQPGILGATSLEILGFSVDRTARKLIPRNLALPAASNPSPAAAGGAAGILMESR